jgi:hypothetical protein
MSLPADWILSASAFERALIAQGKMQAALVAAEGRYKAAQRAPWERRSSGDGGQRFLKAFADVRTERIENVRWQMRATHNIAKKFALQTRIIDLSAGLGRLNDLLN